MATLVYGYSDDTLVIKDSRHIQGDIDCFHKEVTITFDDGAVIRCGYPKPNMGVWYIDILAYGSEHYVHTVCKNEDDARYSDSYFTKANIKGVSSRRK